LYPKFEGLNLATTGIKGRKHQKVHFVYACGGSKIVKHSTHNPNFNDFNLTGGGTGGRNSKRVHF
jgi:hypothetical protein